MKYILLGLMLLTGTLVQAQNTFKARVVDADENEPLLGATVKINQTKGAVADLNGYVEISNIETDTIQVSVSYVGYRPFKKTFVFPL